MDLDKIKEMEEVGLIKKNGLLGDEIHKLTEKPKIVKLDNTYFYQKTKKNKIFEFLKNALIMIFFVTIVYLGSSSNSNSERYEGGKVKGVHR